MIQRRARKSLIFGIIMMGFTATAGQIIIVREFIVVFYGNELCLGLILANWLLWGAIGSWLLGRLSDRIRGQTSVLACCEILLAFLLPALIFVIRSARVIFSAQPGELLGMLPVTIFTFVILAPVCAILGFLFALGARMYPGLKDAKRIGRVYILEGVGSAIGGLLTSLLMIRYMNSLQIAMIVGALNLSAAVSLKVLPGRRKSVKVLFRGAVLVLFLLNLYLLIPVKMENHATASTGSGIDAFKADNLNLRSLRVQWGILGLKTSKNSIYSNLTVVGGESSRTFYSNGLKMFSVPDTASAEQVAHFPMLEHPDPQKVLLMGGGVGGSLGEILKHPVQKVDYVELDPMVIELARKWLDAPYLAPLDDPRTRIVNVDARLFVKRTDARYDVAILDLPEPFTAQLNRFYTVEFFREIKDILNNDGVFSLGVFSSANYLSEEHQRFLNCVYKTLDTVFPDVIIIPADSQVLFIACKSKGILTYDRNVLSERLSRRRIKSLYVSRYQMPAWLEPWRVKTFSERIKDPQNVRINTDFRPVSYYYDMVLWTSLFAAASKLESAYEKVFAAAAHLNLWWFLLPALAAGIVLFITGSRRERIRQEYI